VIRQDGRFRTVQSISRALTLSPRLIVVPCLDPLPAENDLLERSREKTTSCLLVSDDDDRRAFLLRSGAGDVIGSNTSDDEIRFRVDRVLDDQLQLEAQARRQSELESLAYTDGLTGLSNRRFFEEVLTREVSRANRFRRPMALLLMDVDRFKRVNDLLGHDAGDEIIKRIAGHLHTQTRGSDCAARFGGDEFGVVLGDVDASGARTYADRVVEALNKSPMFPDLPHMRCTLSIGIASYGFDPTTPSELLKQADRALYRAKALGRARIEIARW